MKLEDLVPSLELCKQLPKGCFADSALVWWGACVYPRLYPDGVRFNALWHKKSTTPAPTLQELIEDLAQDERCPEMKALLVANGKVIYTLQADGKFNQGDSVDDAMKLWLKLNKEKSENDK